MVVSWTSPYEDGSVMDLSFDVSPQSPQSNGVGITVYQNQTVISPRLVATNRQPAKVNLKHIPLDQGDTVYIHLDKNNNEGYDITSFDPVITILKHGENAVPIIESVTSDFIQTLTQSATLTASAVDYDNLPAPLQYQWSVQDAPQGGNANCASSDKPSTAVQFSKTGEYILSLTVSDTKDVTTKTLVVKVVDNQSPVIDSATSYITERNNTSATALFKVLCMDPEGCRS